METIHTRNDHVAPPAKRRRLSNTDERNIEPEVILDATSGPAPATIATTFDEDQLSKEKKVGITEFVTPETSGFSGVLKQRYTDFLVNEILPNGQVLHLQNLAPPKHKRQIEEAQPTAENSSTDRVTTSDKDSDSNKQISAGEIVIPGEEASSKASEATVSISAEDRASLETIFGAQTVTSIISLYDTLLKHPTRKRKDFPTVKSEKISDREARTQAHHTVRKIFSSKLETTTSSDDTITISTANAATKARGGNYASAGPKPKSRLGWDELGGSYVHFTLYKENKDTMEAVFFLASQLKVGVKNFQFGGTKDRRAVTVQRCSVYRVHAEQMAAVGKRLRNSKIGDYEYCPEGLELGDLGGNEFLITLRDCHFPGEEGLSLDSQIEHAKRVVQESIAAFQLDGFINYYGLQRFGSFTTSTDTVGLKLLQGNYKGAVDDILTYSPATLAAAIADPPNSGYNDSSTSGYQRPPASANGNVLVSADDRARALAINKWETTQDAQAALPLLPHKFSAESNIIRHLGQRDRRSRALLSLNDYQGALQTIPRNLRLMYVHAYQSLIWNTVAGARWEKYGSEVVEGDLVLIEDGPQSKNGANGGQDGHESHAEATDEAGEPIITMKETSDAPSQYQRARALSTEEASSGRYTIFDIVLPLPGFDVTYPPNEIGEIYRTFMASERGGGLDPYKMRRSQKDFSLSGGYRKLMGRAEDVKADVKLYIGEEQLVQTDLERLERRSVAQDQTIPSASHNGGEKAQNVSDERKIAVVLSMKLAPSQYATMALRELMKDGGVRTYKPDYGGAR